MEKNAAMRLVQDALQHSFEKERFVYLVKNILNHVGGKAFTYQGNFIWDDFAGHIRRVERVGKYTSPDGEIIDILIVHLAKDTSLDRARTMQRNFVAKYLNGSRGDVLKDAALVAFVAPNSEDWRFSLVKMEYKIGEQGKVREELTPARRYSFLVGEHEHSHTAQSRLLPLLQNDSVNPTLAELEEAFSVEPVTREFFENYRALFLRLKESLDAIVEKDANVRSHFEEKGISTVDFAKKLLGQIVFLYFLQKKGWFGVSRGKQWGEGSKNFLRELFQKRHSDYVNFFDDVLEPLFYEALRLERTEDYYSRFNCRIPFLNGGLFDPIGDYNWVDVPILLPNDIFSNNRATKQGDKGDGILDVFNRYNFTVKEDEPLEKEVAVDPEMLGKVFENLLEVKDRKSKGTYYTPREIVHYMCQESLLNYLTTELKDEAGRDDMAALIKHGEAAVEHDAHMKRKDKETRRYAKFKLPESIRQHANIIDDKLAAIRVCDPAVGSGAFPVGMMHEIVRTRSALTPYIGNDSERMPYTFKRHAIENSLYGVDLEPGAVEIAKLRLWLSLVVDEEKRDNIKPLPNLDYKIVQGNSLLSADKELLNDELLKKLEALKLRYFDETSPGKKQECRKKIDEILGILTSGRASFDFQSHFSEVFHEKAGFDVVIANPPYVEHKKLKSVSGTLKGYKVYSGTADLYVYFYEIALSVLRQSGILTFISSNKFIRAKYGAPIRGLLAKHDIHNIVDFTKLQVFDALVASCIMLLSKDAYDSDVVVTFVNDAFADDLAGYIEGNHLKIPARSLSSEIWQLEDKAKLKVKRQIEQSTQKLGSMTGTNIFRGVTTGYNPAFIIDESTCKELVNRDSANKEIIKPLLQGRDIKKWNYKNNSHFLIQTGFDLDIKNKYPDIFSRLSKYEDELQKRADQGKDWWNLRACKYYDAFEEEKVIWGLTADKWAFTYDDKGHYLPSNGYILTSTALAVKYLLSLLNSRLMNFYFGFIGIMTAGGAYTLKHETIANLPIKRLSTSGQKPFITLVDKILAITQDGDYLENSTKQAKVREYERQIDKLVYNLYGLTAEEIKIVEESQ